MTLMEMRVVDELVEAMFGEADLTEEDCESICAVCPFAARCGAEGLFWGCGVWEASMGADL